MTIIILQAETGFCLMAKVLKHLFAESIFSAPVAVKEPIKEKRIPNQST